ncbi:TonB-dependent receptor plug domain-containing protein [Marinicella rhabdoformis]|uniref:TonB-dependent receptor plug domain-containing protein n=1 Tax=Marinicella rhabdoformis TaxID=2580566 RepID=UPI0015CFC16B|nr:hypothetical protein [Marinicella rhabdoformis]
MTAVRACLCFAFLVLVPAPSFAELKTLIQWIDFYNKSGEGIFYSSDYLTDSLLNQPLYINQKNTEQPNIQSLNKALLPLKLSLESILQESTTVYVIRPIQKQPISTLLIHAYDAKSGHKIQSFWASLSGQSKKQSLQQSIVLTNPIGADNTLIISATGYYHKQLKAEIKQGKTMFLKVALNPLPVALSHIRVSSSLVSFQLYENSLKPLSREDLANQVSFNHDALRAAENMTGSAGDGISGKIHTRGGNLNESLVLLDNRELRNPYHFKDFFSLFSTINDTVVDSIDYYSGVFPVKYGGRLSAVLDVSSNQWNDLPNQEVNLGLLTSSYTLRYQNPDQDRYYMMALRTGGQFIDKHLIKGVGVRPEYDDGYFKAAQIINQNWQMSQHLLLSRDEIKIDEDDELASADYHDQNLWFQWIYDNLDNHQIHLQTYASRRHDRRQGQLSDDNSQASVNEDIFSQFQGIKFEHQWTISARLLFDYGFDVSTEETQIDSIRNINHHGSLPEALGLNHEYNRQFHFEEHGVSIKSYANARYQWNEEWTMDLGVHYHNQEWVRGGSLSPRLNVAYFPNNKTSWHLGMGRHQQTQHIDELLLEDSAPSYFKPASADLMVLEFNHQFTKRWSFLSEVYYKKYSRTHPYYENMFNGFHVLPDLFYDRIRINPDDAKAAGLELTLKGDYKNINWSTSYTFSDVKDEFESVSVPRSWNQRNAFNVFLSVPVKSWRLSVNAKFHNGWPRTQIVEHTEMDDVLFIGQRNKTMFKDFYQLDLKLARSWQSSLGRWQAEIQLTNALNTNNPCCTDYYLSEGILAVNTKNQLPLLPNFRVSFKW